MPQSIDVLEQLIGPEWRGVPFPLVTMRTTGSTDHVEHKRPDQDGYHVEATGANNLTIGAKLPFRNNMKQAPSEKWSRDGAYLYPSIFRRFIAACRDTTTGLLVHPEFGRLRCKCKSFSIDYDPTRRDGCDVDVEWVESLDDGEFKGALSQPSPVANAIALATQLDANIEQLDPPPPELANDRFSFSDFMRSLQALPDTVTLLSMRVGGIFQNIAAKIERVDAAMKRLNSVRYWPIVDGLEHLRAALFDMERKFGVDAKVIREYLVRTPSTLAVLAQLLGQDIDDMIRLNRDFMTKPIVPRGSRVKYYKASA